MPARPHQAMRILRGKGAKSFLAMPKESLQRRTLTVMAPISDNCQSWLWSAGRRAPHQRRELITRSPAIPTGDWPGAFSTSYNHHFSNAIRFAQARLQGQASPSDFADVLFAFSRRSTIVPGPLHGLPRARLNRISPGDV